MTPDHDDAPLVTRLRTAYARHVGPDERPPLIAWLGFAVTFGITRAITTWLHDGHGPSSGGMTAGGRHLHHYNIGILLLAFVGGLGLRANRLRDHPGTAAAYGTGSALIVDEAALLIDLQDVYWAKDGRKSVDAAVGVIAVGGAFLAAVPFWRAVAHELTPRSLRAPAR